MDKHNQVNDTHLKEQSLISAFEALGSVGQFPLKQKQEAKALFERYGLPSRRKESWHYTDLKTVLSLPTEQRRCDSGLSLMPLAAENVVIPAFGHFPIALSGDSKFFCKNFSQDATLFEKYFAPACKADQTIRQLNRAFILEGCHLSVGEGQSLSKPLELQIAPASGGYAHSGNLIELRANSIARIIERLQNPKDSFQTHGTVIHVGAGATLDYYIFTQGAGLVQLTDYQAYLERGAKLRLYVIQKSSNLARMEIAVDLLGEGADFQLRVVNLLADHCNSNLLMDVNHKAAHTSSREILRNIVKDQAKGSFQGLIRVAKDAQKVDAKMACKSLILSPEASFFAKPELEIFADDVACGHGATIAQLDKNALFYLMARGILRVKAEGLLVKGFAAEVLDDTLDGVMQQICLEQIESWSTL